MQRMTKVNGTTFYFEHRTLDDASPSTVAPANTNYCLISVELAPLDPKKKNPLESSQKCMSCEIFST
jgi:hypothetical protein